MARGPPMRPEPDICRNRHGGNPESVAAFQSRSEEDAATFRERIYQFALRRGTVGITTDEVSIKCGQAPNRVSPRISELRQAKRLVPSGTRRLTRLGRPAMVLIADKVAPR